MRYERFTRQGNDISASIAKTAEIQILSDSISASEGFKDNVIFSYAEKWIIGLPFDSMAMPWSVLQCQSYSRKNFLPDFCSVLFSQRAGARHSSEINPCKYSKTFAQQPHLISLINCGFCLHSKRWFFSRLTAKRWLLPRFPFSIKRKTLEQWHSYLGNGSRQAFVFALKPKQIRITKQYPADRRIYLLLNLLFALWNGNIYF